MCTATWWTSSEEFVLLFNRDEQRNRSKALPPALHRPARPGQPSWAAPTDTLSGGTWIWVNTAGIFAALLNHDAVPGLPVQTVPVAGWISRGTLLASLAEAPSMDALEALLKARELPRIRPFRILTGGLHLTPCLYTWNGEELHKTTDDAPPAPPVSSSSYRSAEVVASRLQQFRETFKEPPADWKELWKYHLSHNAEKPAHSVNMRREDAASLSLTIVKLSRETAEIHSYALPENPAAALPEAVSIGLETSAH
jgi:hypothetical protein